MFKLLNRYRRGVSPVIAVVLLIALTVAAAAVIWAITSGILSTSSASLTTRSVDGERGTGGRADNDLFVTGVFVASDSIQIEAIEFTDDEGETETFNALSVDGTDVTSNPVVPQGESTFQIDFTEDGGSLTGGGYEITIRYSAEAGGSTQVYTFSVSAP